MSAQRAALEAAQARLAQLEREAVTAEQLSAAADALEREVETWQRRVDAGEQEALRRENPDVGARLLGFGFALLFATPVVSLVGVALARQLPRDAALASALLAGGALVVVLGAWPRSRRFLAHRVTGEWRLLARARRQVADLRWHVG